MTNKPNLFNTMSSSLRSHSDCEATLIKSELQQYARDIPTFKLNQTWGDVTPQGDCQEK